MPSRGPNRAEAPFGGTCRSLCKLGINGVAIPPPAVVNSPYEEPARHWALDDARQPTDELAGARRPTTFTSAIPAPRAVRQQRQIGFDAATEGLDTDDGQQYRIQQLINGLRHELKSWRTLPATESNGPAAT